MRERLKIHKSQTLSGKSSKEVKQEHQRDLIRNCVVLGKAPKWVLPSCNIMIDLKLPLCESGISILALEVT